MKLFSPSCCGFFDTSIVDLAIPDDAREVTPEHYYALFAAQAQGFDIVADAAGNPVARQRASAPFSVLAERHLETTRKTRDTILNRLAGIGFAALANGDSATVEAISDARLRLLDITTCAGVLAAGDLDALRLAIADEYAQIAAALPEEAQRTFAENLQ